MAWQIPILVQAVSEFRLKTKQDKWNKSTPKIYKIEQKQNPQNKLKKNKFKWTTLGEKE